MGDPHGTTSGEAGSSIKKSGAGGGDKLSAGKTIARFLASLSGLLNFQDPSGSKDGQKYGSPLGHNPNAESNAVLQGMAGAVGSILGVINIVQMKKAATQALAAAGEAISAPFRGVGGKIAYGLARFLGAVGKPGIPPDVEPPAPPAPRTGASPEAIARIAEGKSIQAGVQALNESGATQEQAVKAIQQIVANSKRELLVATLHGQPGTVVLTGVQFVPGGTTKVVTITAEGVATYGSATTNIVNGKLVTSEFVPH